MARPNAPDGDEPVPAACRETRAILAHFVQRSLRGEEDRVFRQHLLRCAACRKMYRATMASTAEMGRALRDMRTADERLRRHEELRRRAFKAGEPPRHGRRFGLRLALLPVGFILLFVFFGRTRPESDLVLRWTRGEVHAAGELLGAERPEVPLAEGDWCRTGGDARARIEAPLGAFELGLDTQLRVEDPRGVRLRLLHGELVVSGPCTVSSPFGVLVVSAGRARLGIREGRYLLECLEGEVSWVGPTGERRLALGEQVGSDSPLTF